MKKRHIDFVLYQDDNEIIKMRFYPKKSSLHRFNGIIDPKDFNDVYKVYYSWVILKSHNLGFDSDKWSPFQVVFEMITDECSALTYLKNDIKNVLDKKENAKVYTFGQPGSDWFFKYNEFWDWDYNAGIEEKKIYREEKDTVLITVFNNFSNKGFRFLITREKCREFIRYLDVINQHMLENSQPI